MICHHCHLLSTVIYFGYSFLSSLRKDGHLVTVLETGIESPPSYPFWFFWIMMSSSRPTGYVDRGVYHFVAVFEMGISLCTHRWPSWSVYGPKTPPLYSSVLAVQWGILLCCPVHICCAVNIALYAYKYLPSDLISHGWHIFEPSKGTVSHD